MPDTKKTENSYFDAKVQLRIRNLPKRPGLKVLDLFSADGSIWNEIKRRTNRNMVVVRVERKPGRRGVYLRGDNLKFLDAIGLDQFQVIDLDAYGVPFKQLEKVFDLNPTKVTVFVTFIQSLYGQLPRGMLEYCGVTEKMVKKCPSLFMRDGFERFKEYLARKGVTEIQHFSVGKKHYLTFER